LLDKHEAGKESGRLTSVKQFLQSAKSNTMMTSMCYAIALRNSQESSIYARQSRFFLFFRVFFKVHDKEESQETH
jgi:hypothetical protein